MEFNAIKSDYLNLPEYQYMTLIKPFFMPVLYQPVRTLLLVTLFMLSACQSTSRVPPLVEDRTAFIPPQNQARQDPLLAKLYQQHDKWHGTPYRIGGNNRSGIDCSGFVQTTYRDLFGIHLPRTTSQQFRSGPHVNRADLQAGDLVFFRHGRHVGIYLENQKFLHASTSSGVMISDMRNPYWTRHYWRSISVLPESRTVRRYPPPE
ncbi:MAG: NlpC/P60 family protein [Methylophaga sp.]|nr:NlpC/P60 family protein [Methylophaga sp.]